MQGIKKELRKEVQMKVLKGITKIKEKILTANKLRVENDCPPEVTKAIESIKEKMSQCKLSELHPPFLPKTVSKYRHEYFLPIKREYHTKINSQNLNEFQSSVHILSSFVAQFDCQLFDIYLEQIREPYIRKIFNQNYQFDKIDFKEVSTQYKLGTEIQNLLNNTSEWLIQIQRTQDLLERIQLYMDIKTPMLIEKAKKGGLEEDKNRTFGDAFYSVIRNLSSYTLRKSSKIIQGSFFTAVAPAAAMLTLAIIGGNATLPWQSDISTKLLMTPIIALTVPYLLDGLASTIERKEFIQKLEEWAIVLEQIANSIAKFNEELEETILACCTATQPEEYAKEKLNLQKYVQVLTTNLASLTNFSEQKFQQMRDRTEAYFKKYIQIQEGEWTVVIPADQYDGQGLLKSHLP